MIIRVLGRILLFFSLVPVSALLVVNYVIMSQKKLASLSCSSSCMYICTLSIVKGYIDWVLESGWVTVEYGHS